MTFAVGAPSGGAGATVSSTVRNSNDPSWGAQDRRTVDTHGQPTAGAEFTLPLVADWEGHLTKARSDPLASAAKHC